MPIYKIELPESQIYDAKIDGIDNSYICTNKALEKILFNRNLIGLDFTKNCEIATINFLRHIEPEISEAINDIAELIILTKGIYYWMHSSFQKVFNENLQANLVYTSRAKVTNEEVRVVVKALNFDVPANNLIIGDTIASGETICVALKEYIKWHQLKQVFILTIVGSKVGTQIISKFCKAHGIKLHIIYGLAAFGLASNGFDLSFLHQDTITEHKYIEMAKDKYKGKAVSAAGWDFGAQAQAIRKYRMLCWLEEKYWGLENTEVFQETELPDDLRLIEKESVACKETIPDIRKYIEKYKS